MPADEIIDIVDAQNHVMGQMPRDQAYAAGHHIRLVNIVVRDPVTHTFAVQTRGKNVSWQPLHYCVSACGHVAAGESFLQGAQRELREELGIDAELTHVATYPFTCAFGKNFIMSVFVADYPHDQLRIDPREVDALFAMSDVEVRDLLARGDRLHNLFASVMERVLPAA